MDPFRWRQIDEVFEQAIKLSAEERELYLAAITPQDSWLREEVESLISSYEADPAFLQCPAFNRGLQILADELTNFSPGDKIGSYKIISKLGTGGQGSVYAAIDSRLDRKVAIKFLSSNLVKDRSRVVRFQQEARAASRISHPNVAAIYEIGSAKEHHFIAMELVPGITLRERLTVRNILLKDAVGIALQVGSAIEAAHALGIVHRDIKPENIMIRDDGYVKVLDFGLAKLTEAYQPNAIRSGTQDSSALTGPVSTEPGLLMGTATYMSPEQARGFEIDTRTDIWSWGVVLYEIVVGETPFKGATTSDMLADILRGEPALLSSDMRQFPTGLRSVIERCLTKERESRFATISEALNLLRVLQKQLEDGAFNFSNAAAPSLRTQPMAPVGTGQSNVAEATDSHVVADNFETIPIEHPNESTSNTTSHKSFPKRLPIILLFLLTGAILFAIKQFNTRSTTPPQLVFSRLSSEENVSEAVISPDGKYIASVVDEAGSNSLWIRLTNTSANLRLTTPTKKDLVGLTFSHEGDAVYFLEDTDGRWTLYSVPVLGGAPRKLTENLETPVTFSPDGRKIAFVRPGANNSSALIVADADGTKEISLVELKGPEQFVMDLMNSTGPAWSPDGKVIAVPIISETESSHEDLVAVQVTDGSMKRINKSEGFFARIRKLLWLPDNLTLVMTANVQHTAPYQIWTLSYGDGEPKNITNDADDYVGLSATRDGQTFLSTRIAILSSLWTIDRASQLKQILSTNHDGTNGISWTSDGRIIYSRNVAASCDLWVMNADGSGRKQLTFDGQRNLAPTVSPNGKHVVFVSYREGRPHLWTVSADGTGLRQLTDGTYEDMPVISPDSQWVIYRRRNPSGLWRMSIYGGESLQLTKGATYFPAFSPDGKYMAFIRPNVSTDSSWQIIITSTLSNSEVTEFAAPATFSFSPPGLRWTADGSKLTYVVSVDGIANIWAQPISGGPAEQLTNFTEGKIFYYAWSNDGQLACARGNSIKELLLISRPQ